MTRYFNKRYLGLIAMYLSYGSVLASFFIPRDMKDLKNWVLNIGGVLALSFFGLFFYYNRNQWKRFLFWVILMAILYLVVMKLSQPMMEAPFKYKPTTHNNADTLK